MAYQPHNDTREMCWLSNPSNLTPLFLLSIVILPKLCLPSCLTVFKISEQDHCWSEKLFDWSCGSRVVAVWNEFFHNIGKECRPNRSCYKHETWPLYCTPSLYSGKRVELDQPNGCAVVQHSAPFYVLVHKSRDKPLFQLIPWLILNQSAIWTT